MIDPYPQFISNTPIGEDLFEGKSQEKVAHYICENLIHNEKCKIVGIDGGWGTGKSNLIEITKKKLNESANNKYHFFIYDAWGHQEDLQRRSILEEMTTFLTRKINGNSVISDGAKWDEKLKALLAKSKETQKKTIPSLSLGVVFSGLLLLLTPVFKALSEQVHYEWLKIVIVAIPLVLLITVFTYYYYKKTNKTQEWKPRLNEAVQKLFYIYQKSQQSDTTFETISEDEPSVKKFRDWMRDIAADLGENRLIIVFDNMDRLPDNKITELWSSIHTFFAEEKYDRIKVIIPFDRQNIKYAFKHTDENKQNYTDDFINKTFDIVYRVSPPILSDWKKFFESKWLQAFNLADNEFQKVLQIFDHLAECKTPRDMVVFINECVAIHQINPTVPLRYVALFVLNKNVLFKDTDQAILQPAYLKSLDFLYKADEELPKFMAALMYQIEPDRALEVVFADRLKNSLDNNDKKQVTLISENAAFPILLDKIVMEVANLMNATLALNELGDKVTAKVWDDLYQRLGTQAGFVPDAKVALFRLILMSKVTDKAAYLKRLITLLLEATKFFGTDYYNSLQAIEKTIKDNSINLKLADFLVAKKVPAPDFVALLKALKGTDIYQLFCDNAELNSHLAGLDSPGEWKNSAFLARIPVGYDMAKFTEVLTTKMTEYAADAGNLAPYISAYKHLSKKILKPILSDDAIYSLFTASTIVDDFYYDLLCMRIARWENYHEAFAPYFETILADEKKHTIEGVAKNIHHFVDYGDMLLKVAAFNKPLIRAVIIDLTINRRTFRTLNINKTLAHIDEIIDTLKIDPKIMANQLNQWNRKSITKETIADILPNTDFFVFTAGYENELTIELNKLAVEHFQDLVFEQWLTEFEKPGSKIILTSLTVLKNQYPPKATSAIKEVLENIAGGKVAIPDRALWLRITDKLNKPTLRVAMKDIRDMYVSHQEIDIAAFLFFGDWLFEYGDLSANRGTLRRIFKKAVLQASTIAVILRHGDEMKKVFLGSEDKEDFANDIRVLLIEKNEDIRPLANLLEIYLEDNDEESDDENAE